MGERLGQHFLTNKQAVAKIVASLNLQDKETIIEIGPGEGVLTFPLIEACKKTGLKLIAIEKDWLLAENFKKFDSKEFEIRAGDALKLLPSVVDSAQNAQNKLKIVGNIPYYITGNLLRTISELKNKPILTVLMIQQEVAERLSAKPPKMNLLAAATQIWADPELILKLKPDDFNPPPKVNSAVISLKLRTFGLSESQITAYYRFIKALFKQPRKTAANNLSDGLEITKPEAEKLIGFVNLPKNARPQDFNLEKIIELSGRL